MTSSVATSAAGSEVQHRDSIYINGQWVSSTGAGTIDVINAATEEVMGSIPEGTAEDVDRAVQAAKAAFPGWSQTPVEERAAYLQKIAAGLQARMPEIAAMIAREVGMPAKLGDRRGGEARHRRRRAARRPHHRLLRPADRLLRGAQRHDDRPGGDLRPGAGPDPV